MKHFGGHVAAERQQKMQGGSVGSVYWKWKYLGEMSLWYDSWFFCGSRQINSRVPTTLDLWFPFLKIFIISTWQNISEPNYKYLYHLYYYRNIDFPIFLWHLKTSSFHTFTFSWYSQVLCDHGSPGFSTTHLTCFLGLCNIVLPQVFHGIMSYYSNCITQLLTQIIYCTNFAKAY